MSEYPYYFDRDYLETEGHFDICYGNLDADPPIVEARLDAEIETAIGKRPKVRCNGLDCTVIHSVELTPEEESTQAATVAAHKSAAGG